MKLSAYQARALGITPKATKAENGNKVADVAFDALCKAWGLPAPVHEYRFEPTRKWKVDYLFEGWLCLEVEGSPWAGKPCPACKMRPGGRHNRGQGFLDDIQKYNHLAILGYTLVRCTPADVASGAACAMVKRALEERSRGK